MTPEQFLLKYWPLLVTAGTLGSGGIIWLIRLEGKVKQVERTQTTDGARMAKAIDKMADAGERMADRIGQMETTLAGIVGYEKGANEARRGKR